MLRLILILTNKSNLFLKSSSSLKNRLNLYKSFSNAEYFFLPRGHQHSGDLRRRSSRYFLLSKLRRCILAESSHVSVEFNFVKLEQKNKRFERRNQKIEKNPKNLLNIMLIERESVTISNEVEKLSL